MARFGTLFFDFDGTVVDTIEAIVRSVQDTFAHFDFPQPDAEEIKSYIGVPLHNYFPYLAREYYARHDPDEVRGKYREIYAASYGRTLVQPYAGMANLLADLKAAGCSLGIVSSKRTEPIEMTLADTGLNGIFDAIVGSDQVEQFKPLPQTVFLCAQRIGLEDARDALVIGDSPHDIEMGQRAALATCGVFWGAAAEQTIRNASPDYCVADVAALRSLLLG